MGAVYIVEKVNYGVCVVISSPYVAFITCILIYGICRTGGCVSWLTSCCSVQKPYAVGILAVTGCTVYWIVWRVFALIDVTGETLLVFCI